MLSAISAVGAWSCQGFGQVQRRRVQLGKISSVLSELRLAELSQWGKLWNQWLRRRWNQDSSVGGVTSCIARRALSAKQQPWLQSLRDAKMKLSCLMVLVLYAWGQV
mmetsp:Transcript_36046/g.58157  ORF Transcript_36046/g.58157 Transcript_36046/m.58157 type:complete len:107 (-) Transcript_36046:46-366(-)